MFEEMIASIKLEVTKLMLHIVKKEKVATRQSNIRITGEGFDKAAIAVGESNPAVRE